MGRSKTGEREREREREPTYRLQDSKNVVVSLYELYECVLASSVLVAEVGEPPDVTQSHGDRDAGEEKVQLVPPLSSLGPVGVHRVHGGAAVVPAAGASLGLDDVVVL